MKKVEIYTDGSCIGNPGPGGWVAILYYKKARKIIKGGSKSTTSNRMELKAAVEGLRALKSPCNVMVYSDSQYVVSAFNEGWLYTWSTNNWKKSSRGKVSNIDLWKEMLKAVSGHRVTWSKVRAHASNPINQECDIIAKEMAIKKRDAI